MCCSLAASLSADVELVATWLFHALNTWNCCLRLRWGNWMSAAHTFGTWGAPSGF
jgi:hypothetical protein